MKVDYVNGNGKAKQAELYRIGTCLGLEVDGKMHRIGLTRGQWEILRDSAQNAIDDGAQQDVVLARLEADAKA
jgi:hypothetical protein